MNIQRPHSRIYQGSAYLHTIDNLQATCVIEFADIASVNPALSINGLRGVLRIFMVLVEDARTSAADLTAWVRLILSGVAHCRHVNELDLDAGLRRPDSPTARGVVRPYTRAGPHVLGHTVALIDTLRGNDPNRISYD